MSQENVETLYRAYDAVRRKDNEAFVDEMHPEVEGRAYFMEADAAVYRGHPGMRRFMEETFSVFPDWHPEIVSATEYGDVVLAEVKATGRGVRSGVALESTTWHVVRFRDGKVLWWRGYANRDEALKAVGLEE
jgi:ketosteroid isomerase-like protein